MRAVPFLAVTMAAAVAFVHCGAADDVDPNADAELGSSQDALCLAQWSPTWQVGPSANEWWVEVTIGGGTVASAYLEVTGRPNVTLTRDAWGKWTGLSSDEIPRGTSVIAHATTSTGLAAQSRAFPWLQAAQPATDPCTASDAGQADASSGSCANAWAPTMDQGANTNQWWIEYVISGSVRSARLEIVGGATVPLASQWGKWTASYGAGIPSGTSVVLHAESTTGQIARSQPFRFMVDTRPALTPCTPADAGAQPPDAGVDAGASDGGTSSDAGTACSGWSPTWQQNSANQWWIEYTLSGGTARAVRLQIVGGATIALTSQWGKWTASYGAGIPTGTPVVLLAESTTGQLAETSPFGYRVETRPVTKPCTAPADVGLDARPANTTCTAPPRPGSAAPVALTSVFDDVFTAPAGVRVQSPMLMAQRPNDASRWFMAQRDGRIVSFAATGARDLRQVLSTAQLTALTGKTVTQADESGFHGMAFDPQFSANGRLYVSFSTTCDGNVPLCDDPANINGDYYRWATEIGYLTSPDNGATFTGYTRLMHIGRWSQMHYGGSLAFGKDGFLYISSGDGLDDSAAQFPTNFFGKVLRIDPKGTPAPGRPYGIPTTNPYATGVGGRPEIFARGLRNPFRMTADRLTGDIWLGDVGQDTYEEVNRIELGGNYGWPCREGAHPGHAWNDRTKCPSQLGLVDPVMEHLHVGIGRSVTGGYVYRGSAISGFQGTFVYGDFMQKELRGLSLENGAWTSRILNGAGPQDGYASFAEDAAGEIYAVSLFDQKIHKLVPGGAGGPVTFPQLLSQTGCVLANDPTRPAPGLVPYDVNAALWSDGADKERFFAIPDGTRITVTPSGDFDFPIGTVLVKTFSLAGRRVETRLFVRHADGEWGGYSYEWNDAGTDAALLPSGKVKAVSGVSWSFPSRSECALCHTSAAGRSIGLEVGQLNGTFAYPAPGRSANQLRTLQYIGMFTAPVGDPAALVAYPKPHEGAPSAAKARAYLHANCASCHQPNGGAGRSTMDLRFGTAFAATNTCNVTPIVDDFGNAANRLLRPGVPTGSVLSLRMHTLDARRMPPLGRSTRDVAGTNLIDAWIGGVAGCN